MLPCIHQLDIFNLRNIHHAALKNFATINIISGKNGSGKTSFLESIHLLGRGRPLRGIEYRSLIGEDDSFSAVHGVVGGENQNSEHSVGVSVAHNGKRQVKIDTKEGVPIADLVHVLPLLVIDADTFSILSGGSGLRRQFMDWGVFHMKPSYGSRWRAFNRCLRQRNRLLREKTTALAQMLSWTNQLCALSQEITLHRSEYIRDFLPLLRETAMAFGGIDDVQLEYYQGWDDGKDLANVLEYSFERDQRSGQTHYGAHRADIRVRIKGIDAAKILSRGQQKRLVAAMRITQGKLLYQQTQRTPLYLVDDVPAELDATYQAFIYDMLQSLKSQVFMTCIEYNNTLQAYWRPSTMIQKFHVKHGEITQY